jgi:caffeoyl-CoA O-methyltransferase
MPNIHCNPISSLDALLPIALSSVHSSRIERRIRSSLVSLRKSRFALNIIDPLIQAYSEQFSSEEDALLHDINLYTQSHPHANMLSGHVQGKFLEMISCLLQPSRILEIGTFMGYSAICLAKGLKDGGQLHTIEIREEDARTAMDNFRRANLEDKIILHLGNALDIVPSLHQAWDLVFIDADKVGYLDYYKLVLPFVRSGGLIIADNVLFHGEVLQSEIRGKNARAIQAFNEAVKLDESVEKVLLTVRDGLLFIRKK